jgi:hypothetical protein
MCWPPHCTASACCHGLHQGPLDQTCTYSMLPAQTAYAVTAYLACTRGMPERLLCLASLAAGQGHVRPPTTRSQTPGLGQLRLPARCAGPGREHWQMGCGCARHGKEQSQICTDDGDLAGPPSPIWPSVMMNGADQHTQQPAAAYSMLLYMPLIHRC